MTRMTLAQTDAPAAHGPGHTHHHGHDHGHAHDHSHAAPAAHPAAHAAPILRLDSPVWSLMRASLVTRLAIALTLVAAIWAAVLATIWSAA